MANLRLTHQLDCRAQMFEKPMCLLGFSLKMKQTMRIIALKCTIYTDNTRLSPDELNVFKQFPYDCEEIGNVKRMVVVSLKCLKKKYLENTLTGHYPILGINLLSRTLMFRLRHFFLFRLLFRFLRSLFKLLLQWQLNRYSEQRKLSRDDSHVLISWPTTKLPTFLGHFNRTRQSIYALRCRISPYFLGTRCLSDHLRYWYNHCDKYLFPHELGYLQFRFGDLSVDFWNAVQKFILGRPKRLILQNFSWKRWRNSLHLRCIDCTRLAFFLFCMALKIIGFSAPYNT